MRCSYTLQNERSSNELLSSLCSASLALSPSLIKWSRQNHLIYALSRYLILISRLLIRQLLPILSLNHPCSYSLSIYLSLPLSLSLSLSLSHTHTLSLSHTYTCTHTKSVTCDSWVEVICLYEWEMANRFGCLIDYLCKKKKKRDSMR